MKEQILIIGLGQFGMSLARTLCEKGFQVIAVDMDQKLVNEASNFVTDAICLNATEEASLLKLSPKDRDMIICAIGAKEPSILTVALLKQMGCVNIVARASEAIHSRILKAIGAKRVINPENEYGRKLANKILLKSMFYENTSDDINLLEIPVQSYMIYKEIIEIKLPEHLKVLLKGDNRIFITGSKEEIAKIIEENK